MREEFKGFWKTGIAFGLLSSLIYVIYLSLKFNYFWENPFMYQLSGIVTYFIFIILMVSVGIYLRNKHKFSGIGTRQLFQVFFIIVLITEFTSFLYNYIYMVYINPDFTSQYLESTVQYYLERGHSQEDLNVHIESLDEVSNEYMSLSYHIRGSFTWVAIDSIVAMLLSLFMKRPSSEEVI